MIILLACTNCRRTNAVRAVIDGVDDEHVRPREARLVWRCSRCGKSHEWLIPKGKSIQDTARQSLKSSIACGKPRRRGDVYQRLAKAPSEDHKQILFGELIRWWREEAVITQPKAAASAGITVRQWNRIESGESKPRRGSVERVVRAVDGVMEQAYLLIDSDKVWGGDLERRLTEAEGRFSPDALLQTLPEGEELSPREAHDVETALRKLGRVLPLDPDDEHFLFYAYSIYQEYWSRRLGGPITIDDTRAKVIPAIKKLIDIISECESRRARHHVVYLMARGAGSFMSRHLVLELVTHFILRSFTSESAKDDTRRRIGEDWKRLTPMERLVLVLFDLVEPQNQPRLIGMCRRLHGSPKEDGWFPM